MIFSEKFNKTILGLKYKFKFYNAEFENRVLCGLKLKTTKKTIRDKVDQDDAWFYFLAKNSDIIFDIGANVGYTALIAMLHNADRRYVLVDPNPLALAEASKNLVLNNFGKNASYYPAFVSNSIGKKVKFYTVGTGAAGSMFKSHAKTAAKLNNWFMVDTITLDTLVSYYNCIPDLVKIDVEGAEGFVLQGAKELAKSGQTLFLVEMHSTEEMTMLTNASAILKWCELNNYGAWYLSEMKKITLGREIADRGKCHLLLIPATMKFPSYLKGIKQNSPLPDTII